MNDWLLTLARMSAAGALTILAVLLARLALRRFPRKYVCLLWLAVLFRLLCPVTLHSPTSVVPETVESGELVTAWTERYAEETRVIRRGEPGYTAALDAGRTPVYGYLPAEPTGKGETAPDPVEREDMPSGADEPERRHSYVVTAADGLSEPKRAGEVWLPVLSWVWLAGAAALLAWSILKYLRLRSRLREAVKLEDRVYEAEGLDSPFVLGVLRPRIYLPWGMEKEERAWVLLHERAHIRRLDPLWKLLGWLALCLHWFDPLCWLAFSLAMQDMEGACDEAVVRSLDGEERAAYSRLLLALSAGRPLFAATPLGFGEGNVKKRIKSVLRWRKPKRWMAALAVLLLAAVVLLFALGPGRGSRDFPDMEDTPDTWTQMRFYRQEWTDVAAGQRGVWPVEDVKGFKKALRSLLKEGEWQHGGVCGTPEVDWKAILPGKLRWVSGGSQWQLYAGPHSLALTRDGDYVWFGAAVKETDSPDRLYDVDQERMEAILALTEWGQPALTLEPEADLCFAALPWGCTIEDAQAALPGAARDGSTLTVTDAAVCGFRADASLRFEEDEGGTFLNTIALTFTEEPEAMDLERYDRSVLCGELSKVWGERYPLLPQPRDAAEAQSRDFSDVLTGDGGNPERLWYWYTEDFSDEYQWMSGVTAWFERKGSPRVLTLDASGRNLASGRQFEVEKNALTVQEILNLHELLERQLPGGCKFSNSLSDGVTLSVMDRSDQARLRELLRCWPWVKVGYHLVFDDPAAPSPQPHYPLEEGWTLLTEEEAEAARAALEPIRFLEDGSTWVNPADPCFTSFYQDPRELNFSAFMRYFGLGDPTVTPATEEDFRALRDYGYDFWGSPWRHVEDIETHLKRIPASTVEAALRLYFDIGLDDLKTDYRTRYYYLPQTDCFYSRTSDFGPGAFQPQWGERKDDLVRLWQSKTCLTCRKLEDRWIILSFWNENAAGQQWPEDNVTWPPEARTRYGVAPEYQWVFLPEDIVYELEDGTTLTVPAGWRYRVEWVQVTPEGELWLRTELEERIDPALQLVMLRPEDVIPWTEELADRTLCPVYIPAGITYYPRSFGDAYEEKKTLAESLSDENASTHEYDLTGIVTAMEDGYACVSFAGGMEVWVRHGDLAVGTPSEEGAVNEYSRMLAAGREKAQELGYPLEIWGAELIRHRGREKTEESAYYAAYYPTTTGEGTVCVVFRGDRETGFTPAEALLIPPGAEDWP
jgi:beta-lactamase regulating signal transducer with metallopeptidase domain